MAFAHSENSAGFKHDLATHLQQVAELASKFAEKFGAGDLGRWVGLWHDLGKFHPGFQAYLSTTAAHHGPDHKGAGALRTLKLCDALAFLVAGHHGGLLSRADLKNWLRDNIEDGVMTAFEAAGLNLQGTELVVLSACETGLGHMQNGEGIFGLRRAMQEAGAQSVLMSMWSVPDEETQELMTRFSAKWLGGKSKHEAFHEAQLELRKEAIATWGDDRPHYWAAFVRVGR